MTIPPSLNKGDLITVVAPSGKVNPEYVLRSKSVLESWGFRVELGKSVFNEYGRFAGTPEERLCDLQTALDNPESKAIFCARGGYGIVQLLENLSLESFKKNPKWLIGYSDITALHAQINNAGICSIHALMSSHLAEEKGHDKASLYLKDLLFGKPICYETKSHPLNKTGEAKGILRGGNLSVLSGLRGTPYDFAANTILFIEDVGEKAYHIERMMYNLKLGKVLQNLSGLIVGQFSECEEDPLMNKSIYESISELVAGYYDYPVCFDFPVGHVKNNFPLICGGNTELRISPEKVVIKLPKQ